MAEFGVGFKLYGDASNFVGAMKDAGVEAKRLKKDLGDTFGESSVFKNLTIVGALTTIVSAFVGAANAAQKMREEAEKAGKSIDGATVVMARFGDALDQVKEGAINVGIGVAAVPAKVGEFFGSLINRVRGISKEQEAIIEQSYKLATDAEKRLAKAREENSPEKIAAAEEKLASIRAESAMKAENSEERFVAIMRRREELQQKISEVGVATVKGLELQGEVEKLNQRLREEYAKNTAEQQKEFNKLIDDNIKEQDERVKLESKLRDLKFEQKPADEQAEIIQKEILAIQREINAAKLEGGDTVGLEVQLLEKGNVLAKIREGIAKKTADEGERGLQAEVQKNRVMAFRGGATFNEQSDETLREIIRRNQEQASRLQAEGIGQPQLVASLNLGEASRLRFEAQNAQNILNAREELRSNVRMMGVEGARQSFRGDPIIFESMVQRFVEDTRSTADVQRENNQQLSDINQRLLKAGFGK